LSEDKKDNDVLKNLFEKTLVREIMNSERIFVYEQDDVSQAHEKFTTHGLSHLMILNDREQLSGLITPKYLYKTHAPKKIIQDNLKYDPHMILDGDSYYMKESLDEYILRSVMKKDPFVLSPDDSLIEALKNMKSRNVSCIPIVDEEKKLLGTLTNQEVVNFIVQICSN